MKKIGIMGGTFDPIHYGHLNIANAAKSAFALDFILFIPTGVSYMKEGVSSNLHRFEMTKLAIRNREDFYINDIEINREGNTYTCDTLKSLKSEYSDAEFYFICGTDTLFMLEKWKNFTYLFQNMSFLLASRPDQMLTLQQNKMEELSLNYDAQIQVLPVEPLDISSSSIREYLKQNRSYDSYLENRISKQVFDYIISNQLYL